MNTPFPMQSERLKKQAMLAVFGATLLFSAYVMVGAIFFPAPANPECLKFIAYDNPDCRIEENLLHASIVGLFVSLTMVLTTLLRFTRMQRPEGTPMATRTNWTRPLILFFLFYVTCLLFIPGDLLVALLGLPTTIASVSLGGAIEDAINGFGLNWWQRETVTRFLVALGATTQTELILRFFGRQCENIRKSREARLEAETAASQSTSRANPEG